MKCNTCDITVGDYAALDKHMRTVHPDVYDAANTGATAAYVALQAMLTRNPQQLTAAIDVLVAGGPKRVYGAMCGWAEIVAQRLHADPCYKPGTRLSFDVIAEGEDQPADIDDVPPGHRAAARFLIAYANDDKKLTVDLFAAMIDGPDDAELADMIMDVLFAASQCVEAAAP